MTTCDNSAMAEPPTPQPPRPLSPLEVTPPADDPSTRLRVNLSPPKVDRMLCDRCGADMYRMHAVWRCPDCGFKTDCCGW
jgi:hypothetical protein